MVPGRIVGKQRTRSLKLLFIANCHAKRLSEVANIIAPSVTSDWVEVNKIFEQHREEVTAKIQAADLVLYYPVADSWRSDFVRTSHIQQHAKASISLTNVFFEGLHPDITLTGRGGARLQSPLADYHSRTALFAYRAGLSVDQTCALIQGPELAEKIGYRDTWARSLAELHRRAELVDVKYAKRFEEMVRERLPLFVINHPVTYLLVDYTRFILDHIGVKHLPMPSDCFPQWMQKNAIFPVFPYVRDWHSLPYEMAIFKAPDVDRFFTLAQFIENSFARYKDYDREEMMIMTGYDQWRVAFSEALGQEL